MTLAAFLVLRVSTMPRQGYKSGRTACGAGVYPYAQVHRGSRGLEVASFDFGIAGHPVPCERQWTGYADLIISTLPPVAAYYQVR
jgi:hypothetical protein